LTTGPVHANHMDIVWLSDFGASAMLRFDPKTEQFTVYKSTSRNASVRQILGRPGEVWLPESGADKLVVIRE
jgi:virginiamycin B lyase